MKGLNMATNLVPLNDLSRLEEDLRQEISQKVAKLSVSGSYILGANVSQFEDMFAKYVGAAECISVANGTDALVIALKALEIGQGNAILNVANAGGYTTIAAELVGADVVFSDIDENSLHARLIDVKAAYEKAQSEGINIECLVITHLFGLINPELREIVAFARANDIKVIEDCAQAAGAKLDGQHAGTFGDVGTISFYPTKNLGASGDAGAIFTSNKDLAQKARSLRQYGWTEKYKIESNSGQNSRMDELQAAVLVEKLKYLDSWNEKRREIYRKYVDSASANVVFMAPIDDSFVAHLIVIRHKKLNSSHLAEYFQRQGIATGVHYPIPDNRQSIQLKYGGMVDTSVTDRESKRILTIPIFPEMTEVEIKTVCEALENA